jgi:hypothetical protein
MNGALTVAPRGGRQEFRARGFTGGAGRASQKPKPEPKIIHQTFFKSVGPRTYASQVKELANGNHMLVLTEGKRDEASGEIRKTRVFVYSEDFPAFFRMVKESAEFIKAHPLSADAQERRKKFWAKKAGEDKGRKPGSAADRAMRMT